MRLRNHPDLYAGLMFAAFGLTGLFLAQGYHIGTADEMGPGYFPAMLGLVLTLLGAAIAVRAFTDAVPEQHFGRVVWQPVVFVLGAVALFALTLPTLGFAIALFILIMVSSLAGHDMRIRDTLISYLVLFAISYFAFIEGLAVPFPAWPVFLVDY